MRRSAPPAFGLIAATLLAVPGSGPADAVPPAPDPAGVTVPTLDWTDCGDGVYQCTPAPVPLDYRRPGGTQITLQLRRWRTADPATRIGTLFVYAGGPGSSGWDWVQSFATSSPPKIRNRFDIVGFDPRGVHRSQPVSCLGPPAYAAQWKEPRSFRTAVRLARQWDTACQAHSGDLLPYLGTEAQARDLDLLRAAHLAQSRTGPLMYAIGPSDASFNAVNVAVECVDRRYPRSLPLLRARLARVAADFPLTAPGMAYGPRAYDQTHAPACVQWPAARLSRYTGSYRALGSAPILISGNTGDPDTPYADAVTLAHTLANGHLITWAGEGHTARRKSACVEAHMYEYLLRLTLPPAGTVCRDAPTPD